MFWPGHLQPDNHRSVQQHAAHYSMGQQRHCMQRVLVVLCVQVPVLLVLP
jgi:hypothetical protein